MKGLLDAQSGLTPQVENIVLKQDSILFLQGLVLTWVSRALHKQQESARTDNIYKHIYMHSLRSSNPIKLNRNLKRVCWALEQAGPWIYKEERMRRPHLLGALCNGMDVWVDGLEDPQEICQLCHQLLITAPAFTLYLCKNVLPQVV